MHACMRSALHRRPLLPVWINSTFGFLLAAVPLVATSRIGRGYHVPTTEWENALSLMNVERRRESADDPTLINAHWQVARMRYVMKK